MNESLTVALVAAAHRGGIKCHRLFRAGLAALVALALAASPLRALAWGPEGHEAVAWIARAHLTPEAARRVDALLALEPDATLVSISTWADRTREKPTAAWHYVNLPRDVGCEYVAPRDCPGGDCVVAALEAQVQRLRSAASAAERLEALKYVVHFVADLHQPLHAGFADDKGGNTYQLQAFGRGTNLHALWDSGLIHAIDPDPRSLADAIDAAPPDLGLAPALDLRFAPARWARESCRIASRADFYPPRELPAAYPATFGPVAAGRIQAAGLRLAALLNRVFVA